MSRYYAASDVFVLPSLLEACPTVALEALACGTPVVSTDNPGGVELGEIFGADVTVVPRSDPRALARAIADRLSHPRRTEDSTLTTLGRDFGPSEVSRQYREVYHTALGTNRHTATRQR